MNYSKSSNTIRNDTRFFYFRMIFVLLALSMAATACSDSPFSLPDNEKNPTTGGTEQFGLIEVTISGIGTDAMSASAQPAHSDVAFDLAPPGGNVGATIQMKPFTHGSFTVGTRGSGGMRYIYAIFKVRNADANGNPYNSPRQNLTFLAVDTDQTYGITPVSELRLFDGTLLTGATAKNIAKNTIPTGRVAPEPTASSGIELYRIDVLQVFTQSEVNSLSPPAGVSVFPYGFVVRSPGVTSGSRRLRPEPGLHQYDGIVTFAFKMPLQVQANQDPFEITMLFLAMDNNQTRITQSLEGQTQAGNKRIATRANKLNAGVYILPGSTYRGSAKIKMLCTPIRVAGTAANPTSTLFSPLPGFTSLSPDPYGGSAHHISSSAQFTANFSGAVSGANAHSFVIHGSQSGTHFIGDSYTGNGTSSVTTPAGNFFPGEIIEVSRIRGLGACPGTVARYRVEATGGSGNFNATGTINIGGSPQAVALGDLNEDGHLDIVVARWGSHNVRVLLSNGTGGFNSAGLFKVGSRPGSVALGDINGDGSLDIVTSNFASDNVSVLIGNGNGQFSPKRSFPAGNSPYSVALGDLNGDGALDIVTANEKSDDIYLLIGNGFGGFTLKDVLEVGDQPRFVALGDLNEDGVLDIVTANIGSHNISILLSTATGGYNKSTHAVGNTDSPRPDEAVMGDINGDGALDIVVANAGEGTVSVLIGNGNGGFPNSEIFNVGILPNSIALGDLNGDNALDIITSNLVSEDLSILLSNGSGGFNISTSTEGSLPYSTAVGDINGDGALDIVTVSSMGDNVNLLINQ